VNFFWPTDRREDSTALGRFGRVLHWSCALIAALCAVAGILSYVSAMNTHDEYGPDYTGAFVGAIAAAFFWLSGRALRYVFAGE
jgi:hypothetical protein